MNYNKIPCYKSGGVANGVMQNISETIALNVASKVGSRKRHFFYNGLWLCEGQGIELQMFKISTNDK